MPQWWGTYPADGLGTPTGVGEGLWRQDDDGAAQVLEVPAPSFVIAHPDLPLLYAGSEEEVSTVHVIDVATPATPRLLGSIPTGGASACHLLLADDGATLYVSHYMSGDVAVVPLHADGTFATERPAQLLGHSGTGPREDRQEGPHAHFAGYAPGRAHLLVCDLGTDELRRYRIGPDGSLADDGIAATMPPGSGPRHFATRGDLLYVVCELDHTLRTLRWDGASATAEIIAEQPTTTAPNRTGDTLYDAHVDIVGELLLVSVRGADVIAIFDLSPEGEARYRTSIDAGHWPRHFAAVGETLHVGAEKGHEVRAFDLADVFSAGAEKAVGDVVDLPYTSLPVVSPACVVTT